MKQILQAEDLVLVAIMPEPRDMEIARTLGWYRIRLKSAPRIIAVDWLAFYQPNAFGPEHRWKIEAIAPVTGHELAPRAHLFKDETNHPRAYEEYYKIQIGPVQQLANPVSAENWKRINFLYTTGERLMTASSITDLTIKDGERKELWLALRERALAWQEHNAKDYPEFPIPVEVLRMFMMVEGGALFNQDAD